MTGSDWLEEPVAGAAAADPPAPPTPLGAVAARIADVSPAWAAIAVEPGTAPDSAAGIDALGRSRAQGVEAIREGWLLHRGAPRLVEPGSGDLGLLVGDWCYAAGLCTIADAGSLDDVAALAELVADLSARAQEPVEALEQRWSETLEEMHRA